MLFGFEVESARRESSEELWLLFVEDPDENLATIRSLFSACGLRIVELWGDFDWRPSTSGARRLILVAVRSR